MQLGRPLGEFVHVDFFDENRALRVQPTRDFGVFLRDALGENRACGSGADTFSVDQVLQPDLNPM
jgi:hypothetical protein